jgi:hypothetical protein
MADVTGNIGGQLVELNNAATEATLKQLVQAIALMSARMGKDVKTQAQIEKELKKFHDQLKKGTTSRESLEKENKKDIKSTKDKVKATQDGTKALKDDSKAKKDNTTITYRVGAGLRLFGQTASNVALGMTSLVRELSEMGDSATAMSGIFKGIPLVGGVLSGMFGAAAGSAEKLYSTFQRSASVGANFTSSISEMTAAATAAGLTVDQFASIIAKNGESLALLGKGSADGAKRLSELGRTMRTSGLQDELFRMGYSTEEINSALATHGARLARTGALQNMTTQQLAKSTAAYLKDLDAVAKLTGQSKESLQAQEDARMRDAQYLQFRSKLDEAGQRNLENLMKSIPEGMQAGAKEVLATGTATSAAGEQFLAFLQASGTSLQDLRQNALATGTITREAAIASSKVLQEEGKSLADSPLGDTVAAFVPELNDLMVASYTLKGRQMDLAQAFDESAKSVKGAVSGLDPAVMGKLKQEIAAISNKFMELLASSGLLKTMIDMIPSLMSVIESVIIPAFMKLVDIINQYARPAFETVSNLITGYLVPAFTFVADNFKTLATAAIGIGLALKAWNFFQQTKGTVLNPMVVTVMGGGGGRRDKTGRAGKGVDKGVGKAAGGVAKGIGGVVKGAGVVGVLASGAMLASDLSDIKKQEASGDLSKEEAKKARGGAVGGAAGGAGGAMAGAAAGAALGSVVPVVGTIVGGLIGGAIGGWLGRKGGQVVGEAVADDKSGTTTYQDPYAGSYSINGKPVSKEEYDKWLKNNPAANVASGNAPLAEALPTMPAMPMTTPDPTIVIKNAESAVMAADSSRKALEQQADASIKQSSQREEALRNEIAKLKEAESKKPAEVQEKILTAMNNLNSNIEKLLVSQSESITILNNQLSVQQNLTGAMSGDLFISA